MSTILTQNEAGQQPVSALERALPEGWYRPEERPERGTERNTTRGPLVRAHTQSGRVYTPTRMRAHARAKGDAKHHLGGASGTTKAVPPALPKATRSEEVV